jgi:hypothetical protein
MMELEIFDDYFCRWKLDKLRNLQSCVSKIKTESKISAIGHFLLHMTSGTAK